MSVCGPMTLMPKYLDSLEMSILANLEDALNWCDVANVLRIQFRKAGCAVVPMQKRIYKCLWN